MRLVLTSRRERRISCRSRRSRRRLVLRTERRVVLRTQGDEEGGFGRAGTTFFGSNDLSVALEAAAAAAAAAAELLRLAAFSAAFSAAMRAFLRSRACITS